MGKKTTKKKTKGSLIKQLAIILSVVIVVVVVAIVVIRAINKTTIKTITVEGAYSELYIGNPELGKVEVAVSVYPETASTSSLMAYSENPEVATVSFDGTKIVVDAVGVGDTAIVVRHSSKSSLYDTYQVSVKDIDVQTLTFKKVNENGEKVETSDVDVKKDGFEYEVPFCIEPYNGNMNNLKIQDFNKAIFEKVEINQEKRVLVIVPKTEIVQTSAEIDVEIFQNTTEGYNAVQVVSLNVNLKNREAYVNFELSSNPQVGFTTLQYEGITSSKNNIVYLEEPDKTATDVYVRPIIGYDLGFDVVGGFNFDDYDLYFDGQKISNSEYNMAGSGGPFYNYNNKILVTKSKGNYYYFKTGTNFAEGDCIYVEFLHKYTEAKSGLQFVYLSSDSMRFDTSFGLYDKDGTTVLTTGGTIVLDAREVYSLNFTYDTAIDRGLVLVEIYDVASDGTEWVYTNEFGDDENDLTISIKKDNKKLSAWAENLTTGTDVHFNVKRIYWDSRYIQIADNTNIAIKFVVEHIVNGLHIEQIGREVSVITLLAGNTSEVSLVAEPEGGVIDNSEVSVVVTKNDIVSDEITVEWKEDETYTITAKASITGTYKIEFTYKEYKASLYVVV